MATITIMVHRRTPCQGAQPASASGVLRLRGQIRAVFQDEGEAWRGEARSRQGWEPGGLRSKGFSATSG